MSCQRTILLVEDNSNDAYLTSRSLANSRVSGEVELVVVTDGQAALDYLRREGPYGGHSPNATPALVLLDLNLPEISGLDFLRIIRTDRRFCRLPVVILTESQEEEDVCAGYRLGVNSFVRKPVGYKEFQSAIENIGLYWLLVNQPDPSLKYSA